MKKVIWIIGGVFAFVLTLGIGKAMYWRSLTPEQRAERITNRMASKLELTADQKTKVLAINLEQGKAMQALCSNRSHNRDEFKTARETWKTQIDEVLTPTQREKLPRWGRKM
jgi:periplasmic protein CpxP/Spy